MDGLIGVAHAEGAAAPDAGLLSFLPLILMVAVFYFLLIRPQQKRAKEHQKLIAELKKGDEVVSVGGLGGTVTAVGDAFLSVKIANNVDVKLQKQSVASLLPKGTLKDS